MELLFGCGCVRNAELVVLEKIGVGGFNINNIQYNYVERYVVHIQATVVTLCQCQLHRNALKSEVIDLS